MKTYQKGLIALFVIVLFGFVGYSAISAKGFQNNMVRDANMVRSRVDLSDEEKKVALENCKEILDAKLADKTITQEEYDNAVASIAKGEFPELLQRNMFGRGRSDGGIFRNTIRNEYQRNIEPTEENLEACKERLQAQLIDKTITQEEYDAAIKEIEAGNFPQLSNRRRGDFSNVGEAEKKLMIQQHQERLTELLENKTITQEQFDAAEKALENGESFRLNQNKGSQSRGRGRR